MTNCSIINNIRNNNYIVISFLIFAIGLYGIAHVFFNGQEHSYGVSREVPFGLLLVGYAFLLGLVLVYQS